MSNSLCLKERSYFFLFGKFKEMNLSIFFLFNSSFPLDFQTHYMNFSEFLLKKCVKTHVFLNSSGLNEPLVIFCLDRICKNKVVGGGILVSPGRILGTLDKNYYFWAQHCQTFISTKFKVYRQNKV